jgi:hypothetical protein
MQVVAQPQRQAASLLLAILCSLALPSSGIISVPDTDVVYVFGDTPVAIRICFTKPLSTICAPGYTILGKGNGPCDVVTPTCDCLSWEFAGFSIQNSSSSSFAAAAAAAVQLLAPDVVEGTGCVDVVVDFSSKGKGNTLPLYVSFSWQVKVTEDVLPASLAAAVVRAYHAFPGRATSLPTYLASERIRICQAAKSNIPPAIRALDNPVHARDKCSVSHTVRFEPIPTPPPPLPGGSTHGALAFLTVLLVVMVAVSSIWLYGRKKD